MPSLSLKQFAPFATALQRRMATSALAVTDQPSCVSVARDTSIRI
jgi:hypothetical protein